MIFVTPPTMYGDCIAEDEGGKTVPLTRPAPPTELAGGSVLALRRHATGWSDTRDSTA